MIKIFFDTEFTGLQKDTELISIGCVADTDTDPMKYFYAEINDYDRSKIDDWLQQNVINNLYGEEKIKQLNDESEEDETYVYGTKQEVALQLKTWLKSFDEPIQLVSDVCHYDMVLFIDLFGSAWDVPKCLCPCCYDINQDIAQYLDIDLSEAFDINREDFLRDNFGTDLLNIHKHNSMDDAYVIYQIYNQIHYVSDFRKLM